MEMDTATVPLGTLAVDLLQDLLQVRLLLPGLHHMNQGYMDV